MWGQPLNQNPFKRTIYGDNLAAIGLAVGNTCSSWRTRHLRIRASILREAMDEGCEVPGGVWQLLHLKGSELVADGLTKQLLGQAFAKFVVDLGLKRSAEHESLCAVGGGDRRLEGAETSSTSSSRANGNVASGDFAAVKAMVLGGTLLSMAEAAHQNETEEEDLTLLWVTGATLMALGAVYAGQLVHSASRCCLRRLRVVENSGDQRSEDSGSTSEGDILVLSDDDQPRQRAPEQGLGASTRTRAPGQGRGSSKTSGTSARALEQSCSCASDLAVVSAASSSSAAALSPEVSNAGVQNEHIPENPWNRFQHETEERAGQRRPWLSSIIN